MSSFNHSEHKYEASALHSGPASALRSGPGQRSRPASALRGGHGLLLCLSDGNQASLAFQWGALQALQHQKVLLQVQIWSASGAGNLLLAGLVQHLCHGATTSSWPHQWNEWMSTSCGLADPIQAIADDLDVDDLTDVPLQSSRHASSSRSPPWPMLDDWVQRLVCTNLEREMWWTRFKTPWRWLSSDTLPDWKTTLSRLHFAPGVSGVSPPHCVGQSPTLGTSGASQNQQPGYAVPPTFLYCDSRFDERGLAPVLVNAPVKAMQQGADALGFSVKALENGAIPLPILHTNKAGGAGGSMPPPPDPLAIRAGSLFAIKQRLAPKDSKATTDHLILLDGFIGSPFYREHLPPTEQRHLLDAMSQLVRSPDGTYDDTRAYRREVAQLATFLPCPECGRTSPTNAPLQQKRVSCPHVDRAPEDAKVEAAIRAWQRLGCEWSGLTETEYQALVTLGYWSAMRAWGTA